MEQNKIKQSEIRAVKKKERRQQKAEERTRKREAYKALGRSGRFKLWGKRVLAMICGVVVIGNIAQWVYPIAMDQVTKNQDAYYNKLLEEDVTKEEILKLAPMDKEGSAVVEKMRQYSPDDTWAIYIYVCGSDLESGGDVALSDTTQFLIKEELESEKEKYSSTIQKQLMQFISEIKQQGMDLPQFMYQRQESAIGTEEEDAQGELPGYASSDIEEIMAVELPENIKIVLQTGGALNWKNKMINPNRSQRFLYDSKGLTELEDHYIRNMADPDTLTDFLTYSRNEYPADRTMMLFWNHGAGSFGYGVDEVYGNDTLSLKEMRQSLEKVYQADAENPAFEVIGFDACLMASMEVAETFQGYGKYLVASEELAQGEGWDYTEWLSSLAKKPEMNGAQLGKAIVDSYIDFYAKRSVQLKPLDMEVVATMSVVDLNKVPALYEAYERLVAAALRDTANNPGVPALLGRATNRSVRYGEGTYKIFNTVDLGLFMENISEIYPNESDEVRNILDEAVLYKRATSYASDSKGLSVYYPTDVESLSGLANYLDYINNISDSEVMKAMYYYKIAGSLNEELQEYADRMGYGKMKLLDTAPLKRLTKAKAEVSKDGSFSIPLEGAALPLIQEEFLDLVKLDEENDEATFLGESVFSYSYEDEQLDANLKGDWISIDGNFLAVEILDLSDSAIKYRSRILYNGADAYLILGYNLREDKLQILGVKTVEEESEEYADTVARKTESIRSGDKIQPVYNISRLDSSESDQKNGKAFTYKSGSKIESRVLDDGKYAQFIMVKDARGDEYRAPAIVFMVDKGKITKAGLSEEVQKILMD